MFQRFISALNGVKLTSHNEVGAPTLHAHHKRFVDIPDDVCIHVEPDALNLSQSRFGLYNQGFADGRFGCRLCREGSVGRCRSGGQCCFSRSCRQFPPGLLTAAQQKLQTQQTCGAALNRSFDDVRRFFLLSNRLGICEVLNLLICFDNKAFVRPISSSLAAAQKIRRRHAVHLH